MTLPGRPSPRSGWSARLCLAGSWQADPRASARALPFPELWPPCHGEGVPKNQPVLTPAGKWTQRPDSRDSPFPETPGAPSWPQSQLGDSSGEGTAAPSSPQPRPAGSAKSWSRGLGPLGSGEGGGGPGSFVLPGKPPPHPAALFGNAARPQGRKSPWAIRQGDGGRRLLEEGSWASLITKSPPGCLGNLIKLLERLRGPHLEPICGLWFPLSPSSHLTAVKGAERGPRAASWGQDSWQIEKGRDRDKPKERDCDRDREAGRQRWMERGRGRRAARQAAVGSVCRSGAEAGTVSPRAPEIRLPARSPWALGLHQAPAPLAHR